MPGVTTVASDDEVIEFEVTANGTFENLSLPDDVSADYIDCQVNGGLSYHVIQCGVQGNPLVLLLHGFPELAMSWAKLMPSLAQAQNYVVAIDQRGFGRTSGWDVADFELVKPEDFSITQYVADAVTIAGQLGYNEVQCVVGHGFGAHVASMCALLRPDMFKSCILISEPLRGLPEKPAFPGANFANRDPLQELSRRNPAWTHYKHRNASKEAASEWASPEQGLHAFLQGLFYIRSGEYHGKAKPAPMKIRSAEEMLKLPRAHIFPQSTSLDRLVADLAGEEYNIEAWFPSAEFNTFVREWERTGFQGALNHFRFANSQAGVGLNPVLQIFVGSKIAVPLIFVTGEWDWTPFEEPRLLEKMQEKCLDFRGVKIVRDAGHWPHMEQSGCVAAEILTFLWTSKAPRASAQVPAASDRHKLGGLTVSSKYAPSEVDSGFYSGASTSRQPDSAASVARPWSRTGNISRNETLHSAARHPHRAQPRLNTSNIDRFGKNRKDTPVAASAQEPVNPKWTEINPQGRQTAPPQETQPIPQETVQEMISARLKKSAVGASGDHLLLTSVNVRKHDLIESATGAIFEAFQRPFDLPQDEGKSHRRHARDVSVSGKSQSGVNVTAPSSEQPRGRDASSTRRHNKTSVDADIDYAAYYDMRAREQSREPADDHSLRGRALERYATPRPMLMPEEADASEYHQAPSASGTTSVRGQSAGVDRNTSQTRPHNVSKEAAKHSQPRKVDGDAKDRPVFSPPSRQYGVSSVQPVDLGKPLPKLEDAKKGKVPAINNISRDSGTKEQRANKDIRSDLDNLTPPPPPPLSGSLSGNANRHLSNGSFASNGSGSTHFEGVTPILDSGGPRSTTEDRSFKSPLSAVANLTPSSSVAEPPTPGLRVF